MDEQKYSKWTVEGDKKTRWICGCFQTARKAMFRSIQRKGDK